MSLNTNVYGGSGFGAATYVKTVGSGGVNSNYVFANGSNGINAVDISSSVTKINTPLLVNGRDVMAELDEMRDAMLLLKRHVDMEEKYPKLRELKDAYERQLEKYKTFEALK